MTCPYETVLGKPCGRPAPNGYCDLHSVLVQLDAVDWHSDEFVITVPATVRPLVDRILSDVLANFDAMPCKPRDNFVSWHQNPTAWLNLTPASMRRNEARRAMNGESA